MITAPLSTTWRIRGDYDAVNAAADDDDNYGENNDTFPRLRTPLMRHRKTRIQPRATLPSICHCILPGSCIPLDLARTLFLNMEFGFDFDVVVRVHWS